MSGARIVMVITALVVSAAFVAGATASSQALSGGSYKVVGKWGKTGTGNGQFTAASGIAVDEGGDVYVADSGNDRVQYFSASGAFKGKWGSIGDGDGQFARADDVDIAADGTVWVADDGNSRAQSFTNNGGFRDSIGLAADELARGLAVAASGDVLIAVEGDQRSGWRRYSADGQAKGGLLGGMNGYRADDIEAARDGTVYVVRAGIQSSDDRIQHFSADGKLLGNFKIGAGSGTRGIAADLDCNVWAADAANRQIVRYSPSGKKLGTATSPDLIANDIAFSPKGDMYVIDQSTGIVRFAEDKAKPGAASVPGKITVAGGKTKIAYAASGFACPAEVSAVATLSGGGVSGKAAVKVAAGKVTAIAMNVKGPAGSSAKATFKIVLKTNGRPTIQTKSVTVSFK